MTMNAWERSAAAEGLNESEQKLLAIARRSFLSLWCYGNVFRQPGEELSDLLVIFGEHVVLIEDKSASFNEAIDPKVAYGRWYGKSIGGAASQLAKARRWLERNHGVAFMDAKCEHRIPLEWPPREQVRYHYVAVARGIAGVAQKHFGTPGVGGLKFNSALRGEKDHLEQPFEVGYLLEKGPFVHVLDERALEVLFSEVDTVADLINYLEEKEEFLATKPDTIDIVASAEEDFIPSYFARAEGHRHLFPRIPPEHPPGVSGPDPGAYERYARSPAKRSRVAADQVSYLWDQIIEVHSDAARSGQFYSPPWVEGHDSLTYESILQGFAAQTRVLRRALAQDILAVRLEAEKLGLYARKKLYSNRGYVLLAIKRHPNEVDTAYFERRSALLDAHVYWLEVLYPEAEDIIGFACEAASGEGDRHSLVRYSPDPALPDEVKKLKLDLARSLGLPVDERPIRSGRRRLEEHPASHPMGIVDSEGPIPTAEERAAMRAKANDDKDED